ncbi:hypothetical protein [Neobacillus cucumis]|uniref:hypothetical protein n=1 Tax=Neobacillus cucumis TaxID=1740721 RepID=UPI001FDE9AD4|nr:hypothetical protein [Neobacillus cucumis]MBM7653038.1 type II secretory pathway component PulF [Neobacillus cucumis]
MVSLLGEKRGKEQGVITAASRREAMVKLKDDGVRVVEMSEVLKTLMTMELSFGNPDKMQDFVIYLRQFATLLKAGVTIVEVKAVFAAQTESKGLKRALLDVVTLKMPIFGEMVQKTQLA